MCELLFLTTLSPKILMEIFYAPLRYKSHVYVIQQLNLILIGSVKLTHAVLHYSEPYKISSDANSIFPRRLVSIYEPPRSEENPI